MVTNTAAELTTSQLSTLQKHNKTIHNRGVVTRTIFKEATVVESKNKNLKRFKKNGCFGSLKTPLCLSSILCRQHVREASGDGVAYDPLDLVNEAAASVDIGGGGGKGRGSGGAR